MASTASISGLISGLKTDDIIAKTLEFGRRPITIMEGRQAQYTARLTAWQEANTRLLALKTKADSLSSRTAFGSKTATVSDDTLLSATASLDASPGNYTFTVNRLATAQQVQSQAFTDTDQTTVGTGTVTVGVGADAKTVTLDATNNTLGGLRDAINKAGVGVSASILDFGSLDAHEYHLALTSNTTGAQNTVRWTPNLAGGVAVNLATTVEAFDSSVTIGTGATAKTVTKSGNRLDSVIPGLTLNLKTADVAKPVNVSVTADTAAVKEKVKSFVTEYNSVMDFMDKQFSFDADTGVGGALLGDFQLQNVQNDLRGGILGLIPGLPSSLNSLSQAGFSADNSDRLVMDEAKFDATLAANPNGVMKLFAGSGTASDYSVTYLGSTDATKASGADAPYKIRVDQPATPSQVTSGAAQAQNLAADETLTLNNSAIALTAGMTPQQVVDAINARKDQTGVQAFRTGADGTGYGDFLTLRRSDYGPSGHISVTSTVSNGGALPTSDTTGFGTTQVTEGAAGGETGTGVGAAGRDVTGAFGVEVNGSTVWESATGNGQILIGNPANAHTEGLKVRAASSTAGEHGTVTLTKGIGQTLNELLGFLTGKDGSVMSAQDTLNKQIGDMKDAIKEKEDSLSRYEDDLRSKYAQLEGTMGALQSQGNYLSSQFASLNKSK